MSKNRFITDLRAGTELLHEPFLLHDVVRRQSKDGRPFLLATLRDRTGQMAGVYWDVPLSVDVWARPGLAVLVSGRVNLYKEALQVNISELERANGLDMTVFLPASQRPLGEMRAELRDLVDTLTPPWRELVARLLLDGSLAERFAVAPAARGMHHAYVGGLLEHTLSMAEVARLLAAHYPYVNSSLLLSGVLLHDIGKAEAYSLDEGLGHSDDGRLIGHILRGALLIEREAAELAFPAEELQQLLHLIASHHGTLEWGSPVVPRTLEAVLLHQIDLLDSRIAGYLDHVRNDAGGGVWTTKRSDMFGTELRRPEGL
jgi:3'-5' exoribonuclease